MSDDAGTTDTPTAADTTDAASATDTTGMGGPSAPRPSRSWSRALLGACLLVIAALAVTALILTLDHPPTETGRPELTAREHALLVPRLAAIDASVDQAVAEAATLAVASRDVLTRARALDPDGVDAAITTGSQASAAISMLSEQLLKAREVLTSDIDASRIRESDRARIGTIDAALIGIAQLPGTWVEVVGAASGPVDLVRSIQAHDARVAEAAAAARADDLPGAIVALEDSRRLLVAARAVREAADQAGADVSTIDDLLARLEAYDSALERLWTLLVETDGQVTDEVRAAFAAVEAAQGSLPLTEDALTVVVSDLAGPAIMATLQEIEQQRGLLADAVAARPDTGGG
ncbi:MAG: hypothetical protein ABWZ82_09125 [Candidatus Limnocylindrales bacterium]